MLLEYVYSGLKNDLQYHSSPNAISECPSSLVMPHVWNISVNKPTSMLWIIDLPVVVIYRLLVEALIAQLPDP
jgi:hypothetical protein